MPSHQTRRNALRDLVSYTPVYKHPSETSGTLKWECIFLHTCMPTHTHIHTLLQAHTHTKHIAPGNTHMLTAHRLILPPREFLEGANSEWQTDRWDKVRSSIQVALFNIAPKEHAAGFYPQYQTVQRTSLRWGQVWARGYQSSWVLTQGQEQTVCAFLTNRSLW